jgi:tetratricopeptide (TPR) repeat protein
MPGAQGPGPHHASSSIRSSSSSRALDGEPRSCHLFAVTNRLLPALAVFACACGAPPSPDVVPRGAEAISLLGDTLRAPGLPPATRAAYERRLAEAERDLAASPNDPDALVWVGRRTAYLGRYRDAIEIFSRGVAEYPRDARFLRHRGHRWITVRRFDRAALDLARAERLVRGRQDETEPDGLPNPRGIPTSTLQSNIHYHLALALYLEGDWRRAAGAWRTAVERSPSLDNRIAASYWLYLTLRRLGGRGAEISALLEPVTPELDIIENTAYFRLLLAFRPGGDPARLVGRDGALEALEDATTAYGVGAWLLLNGDTAGATGIFEQVRAGGNWASFGYIAAEAELARLGRGR